MKRINNFYKIITIGLFIAMFPYYLWTLRPVKILSAEALYNSEPHGKNGIYIDSDDGFPGGYYYNIAVDHLPLTKWDQIHWYLSIESQLKASLHIPEKTIYHISLWSIGEGFINPHHSSDSDLVCFRKINSESNCIEENRRLSIETSEDGEQKFDFSGDDHSWVLTKQGALITYD